MNYLNYYTRTRELISSLYVGLVIMPKALIECLKLKPKIVNKVRFLIFLGCLALLMDNFLFFFAFMID